MHSISMLTVIFAPNGLLVTVYTLVQAMGVVHPRKVLSTTASKIAVPICLCLKTNVMYVVSVVCVTLRHVCGYQCDFWSCMWLVLCVQLSDMYVVMLCV